MSDNVTTITKNKNSLSPDELLEKYKGQFESLIIIGIDKDEVLGYDTSQDITNKDFVWALERAKYINQSKV